MSRTLVMRTEAEVAAVLAQFEAETGVFELTVRGVSVWRIFRFPVGFAVQNAPFVERPLPRGELFGALLRSLRDLVWLPPPARYAVKSYVSALRIPGKSGYEDVYFERLLEAVPGGVRLYSFNAGGYSGRKSSASSSVDCTAVLVLGAILAKLFPVRGDDEVFVRLGDLIEQHLGVAEFPAARIRRMFSSYWWQSRMFKWLLKRLGPRTVLAADTGERALLSACRQLGIRFIEMQHGIFTPDHPDSLPSAVLERADTAPLLLPDRVALYGDYWRARLAQTALGKLNRLVSVGASVLESFRRSREESFRPSDTCPRLLVTTQGIDRDALIDFLAGFLALYRDPCLLTVKLHPAYDRSDAPYTKMLGSDPRVRIIGGSDDPNTYDLLVDSDLHLSIASACHYDALGIGTPTLVIGLAGHSLVQGLVDSGDALLATNPEVLAEIVSKRGWNPVLPAVSDKYYRGGFVENILPLIA